MTGLGDGEKEKHINTFKTYLPWSLGVIALLEQGSFKELYYHGGSESIAILNGFFEWIVFCAREEGFPIILEHIKRRNIQSRIVYTSKNNISSNILEYLEHRQFHIMLSVLTKLLSIIIFPLSNLSCFHKKSESSLEVLVNKSISSFASGRLSNVNFRSCSSFFSSLLLFINAGLLSLSNTASAIILAKVPI